MVTDPNGVEPVTIAVFARAPVVGAVKTRLIPRLGAEGAARLHAELALHALRMATAAGIGPVTLWGAPDARHPFFHRCQADFGVALYDQAGSDAAGSDPAGSDQAGSDLGARMLDAFRRLAPAPVLLIGCDCPAMTGSHLLAAANALRAGQDAAFLPAEDGGYGLVGLRRPVAALFTGMAWGGANVMAETRRRLGAAGLAWAEPATVWDIDRPEDVARLAASGLLPSWQA
jgi:glycosyltransferase A (GT-A) superfamily protein (DUF2064 family)